MPFLDILVQINNYRTWPEHARLAAQFAAMHEAHLTGIYVRRPVDFPFDGVSLPVVDVLIDMAQKDLAAAAAAKASFLEFANGFGVRGADWICAEDEPARVLTLAGTWNDLLVLGPAESDREAVPSAVEETLIESGMPCLVVPEGSVKAELALQSIALAWNGSVEAMRAIHSALPMLIRAHQVILLAGPQRVSSSNTRRHPDFDLETFLRRHHIRSKRIDIHSDARDASSALLSAAQDAAADLLVMGAYGHTRLSEWVLGGTTRRALRSSPIPLFMRH